MNSAIIYATKTGHSKKIAEKIADAMNLTAMNVAQNPRMEQIDLLYIVGGIYGGKSLPQLLDFIQTLDNINVKKVVLMTSCVSGKSKQNEVREILSNKAIEVMEDEFVCPGKFLFLKAKHPDQEDISQAIAFAKEQGGAI